MKKNILPAIFSLLFAAVLMAVIPTEADAEIYTDTLRLHILAASDSEEDQALKLAVRDEVLKRHSAALSLAESLDDALEITENTLGEIKQTAERVIRERGYSYDVTVTLGQEWYDTREYEDFVLPRGEYSSLIIKIGEGKGKNWWCVMYPAMCLDIATEKAASDDAVIGYTKAEVALISNGKYNIKFKLLEVISDFIAKRG